LYGLLHVPAVQTWLVKKVTTNLSNKLHTKVSIESVDFTFFYNLKFKKLLIEDRSKDTLLYAGAAIVNVNDWFFTKNNITLKDIQLEDATIHVQRHSKEWNYQFILDYFSDPKKDKRKSSLVLDLKKIRIKNLSFISSDYWIGEDMNASIQDLNVNIKETNFNKNEFKIDQINLVKPVFSLYNYDGSRTLAEKQKLDAETKSKPAEKSTLLVSIKKINITDGTFLNDEFTIRKKYTDKFDELHFRFDKINGTIDDAVYSNDELLAKINIGTQESCGFNVKKLEANVKMNGDVMEFKNLDIITNKSRIGNYYAMHYSDFNEDMKNFITNVKLQGDLKESNVHTDDIAFFAPELKDWHRLVQLNGLVNGTIDQLNIKNAYLKSKETTIQGDLNLKNIPDIDHLFLVFNSTGSTTNFNELIQFIPSISKIKQPQLTRFGNIYFKGHFTGFLNDFVADGNINTDLGNVQSDIKIVLPEKGIPTYSGNIKTTRFNLGEFINNKILGRISLDGNIDGSGFTIKDMRNSFNGIIPQFEFNGYNYQNIKTNGSFKNNKFTGSISILDSNLMINNLAGEIGFYPDKIGFNLQADVENANLKNIKLLNQNLSFGGKFNLNFNGSNIDDFLGQAEIFDANLSNDKNKLSFEKLILSSSLESNTKTLSLVSNEINASIIGKFKIMELPDAFKLFLHKYYPSYISEPKKFVSNQEFDFDIKTNNIQDYLSLINKNLSGGNNANIKGNLNLSKNELNVQADIPDFGYEEKHFNNILIDGKGNLNNLSAKIDVEKITLSDSLTFPNSELSFVSKNDSSEIALKTSTSGSMNEADLHALVTTYSDGASMQFYPSTFIINEKKWQLKENGEITLRRNVVSASEISLTHDNESISISTSLDEINNHSNIKAELNDIMLEDFIPLLFTDPELKGKLSGTVNVNDPFGKMNVDFMGKVDSLMIEKKLVGNIFMNGISNAQTGLVEYRAKSNDTTNIFDIDGQYNYKDSSDKQLMTSIKGKKINLSLLEPYLSDVFSQLEGDATTDLVISGGPNNRTLVGNAMINNGILKSEFTQVRYFIKNQTIIFKANEIDFSLINISDSLKNTATLNGKITHQFFDDFEFKNLTVESDKLSLLNTKKQDNAQFYGNIIGNVKFNLNGKLNNLKMNITGEPMSLDSSHIYISTSDQLEASTVNYIDFMKFGKEIKEKASTEKTNILISLNIKANPACKVDVILDEETGDVIKGQGNGNFAISFGNVEPLKIRGNYALTKGEYTFNFQTFLTYPFTLNRGNISWNGDPYQALIDIDANYDAQNVDLSVLASNNGFVQKTNIKIIAHLSGVLQKPTVKFDFELPENSEARRNDIIVKRLAEFKNDENEMNKQVASLLLFNTFIIGNQNFLTQGNASTLITNTIGGMVSSLLTTFFNKELEKATKGILSTYIDINPTLDLQKSASTLQANIRAGLKILLNKRLVMLVGGNLDYNNPTYTQQLERKGLLTPDITIEWAINKDGSLRVVGFNRSSIDFTLNQRNRSGLQLSYRKDLNKITDIFKSKKRIAEEDSLQLSPRINQ
jgi:hypothetical protein